MKKIIAVIITLSLTFISFAACNTEETEHLQKAGNDIMSVAKSFERIEESEYIQCGQSGGLTLSFQPNTTQFKVVNSDDGSVWNSNPQNPSEDINASNLDRLRMMSLLELEYTNTDTKKRTSLNIYTSNVRSEKYEIFTIKNGVVFKYNVTEVGKYIFLAVYLENNNLISEFWYEDSENKSENVKISSVSILPYFVRGSMYDKGYLFLPDGSGALVDFSDTIKTESLYSRPFYGYEPTLLTSDYYLDVNQYSVYIPVYGARVNDSAIMAICEDGVELGVLSAEACGQTSSYARAYTNYTLLNSVEYSVGNYDTELFDNAELSLNNLKTRYVFLSGKDADYSGMARTYRNYLVKKNGLTLHDTSPETLYADVYAAVIKKVSTFGIPYDKTILLTNNEQLESMVENLNKAGVEDIVVRYRMWNDDEIKGNKVNASAGAKGISIEKINDISGADIYPAILNIQTYSKGNYLDHLINASKSITQLPFSWESYSLSNLNENGDTEYRVSVEWFKKNNMKLISKLKKKEINNIALGDVANSLYCDYKGKGYKRDKTLSVMLDFIKHINENFDLVMLDSPNAYAAVYADVIYNTPIDHSNQDILSKNVPFYSMVMSGIADCTAPVCKNKSDDNELLNAVAAGVGVCADWISVESSELVGTELSGLSNINFASTVDDILSLYFEISKIYSKVNGSRIYSHNYINDNVSVTEYENGLRIYVNFGDTPFVFEDGIEISPKDFFARESE